jgi:F420-0:gamma-glutamyl ligase-like protein
MLNLTLKNVPPELHARLKASAEANRRSLNREILARLEAHLDAPVVDVEAELRALENFVAALPRVDHTRVGSYRDAGRE